MDLTFVITCFNLGQYLEECLKSLYVIKNANSFEVIIVNDGSTDLKTLKILSQIKLDFPDVVFIDQTNQGLGKARNNGIYIAQGKYIIPVDADNLIRPEMALKGIAVMENNPKIGVVYGNAQFFGLNNKVYPQKQFNPIDLIMNNYIDACACFRKSCWKQVGGYDESMPHMGFEDWDFWLRLMRKDIGFQFIDEIFFDYRVRENSMLTNAWKNREELITYIFKKPELELFQIIRDLKLQNDYYSKNHTISYLIKLLIKKLKMKYL